MEYFAWEDWENLFWSKSAGQRPKKNEALQQSLSYTNISCSAMVYIFYSVYNSFVKYKLR